MDTEQLIRDVADRVRELVTEAERRAAEIVSAAEDEARRIRAEAEEQARDRLDQVRDALTQLETGLGGRGASAEVVPEPVIIPEPGPAPVPEPTPDPTPEPGPVTVPEPTPPPIPEPTPPPDEADLPSAAAPAATQASTDDLIAQLKSGGAKSAGAGDGSGARLVAMKMALDGASREEVDRHLAADVGDAAQRTALLDDVFARTQA